MPAAVTEAVAFYRSHPVLLVVVLVLGAGLAAAVLVDGGVDLGEAFAVIAVGAVVGVLVAAVQALRRG